tara:strand:+ start:140 stop:406 length:267 start_codon:yes stop_codon:yes gene_type:complete
MSATITANTIRTTENHILVWYRANSFSCENAIGYVQKCTTDAVGTNIENIKPKDTFQMPANPRKVQKTDADGNVMTAKNGEPLTFLVW